MPRLGTINTHESTRKLARRIEAGTARILSATVSRTAQRWFVSFTVEIDRPIPERHARPGSAIGIDLGVKALMTGVNNAGDTMVIPSPRALSASLRRLLRASRDHARKRPRSENRRKSAARLGRLHARVANIRANALHKATSGLACRYETVIVENLNVAGMVRNRRLARAVSDWGSVRRDGCSTIRRHGTAEAGNSRPLVSLKQDVLGLRDSQSQAAPVRANLSVRLVQSGP